MKKRVKTGQLSLLFSLMIIGVLALIVIISISDYNNGVKEKLKGELGSGSIFPMSSGGPCLDTSDTIMKLYSSTNSHGALWNDSNYLFSICYNNIFGNKYSGSDPHVCKVGNTNKVVGLSDVTNAHLEIPGSNFYGTNVCYGDLSCRNVSGSCDVDEKAIIALSASTNAHASNQSDSNYPINICCKAPGACLNDAECSGITPKCTTNNLCVQCINDSQCSGTNPKCNSNGICVICIDDSQCPAHYGCNTQSGQCIITDTSPPNISSVTSSPASLSSVITWTSDENSNSSISYGTDSSNMNNSVNDSNMVSSHSLELSGLVSSTVYYFSIKSCDVYNNCVTNSGYSFTTSAQTSSSSSSSSGSTTTTTSTNNKTRISFEEKSIEVGKLIEFSISADGLNQSRLDYSVTDLPNGASFDKQTGKFSWTPSIAGEYTINFSVTDKKLTNINIIRVTVTQETTVQPIIPQPSPTNISYGTFIFWIIVIVLIISIIIIAVLIVIFLGKKQTKNKFSSSKR